MKKLFVVILLSSALQSFAQTGYVPVSDRYRHLGLAPRAFTVPAGPVPVLQTGQWTASGGLFVDTVGGGMGLWYYLSGVWIHVADSASAAIFGQTDILQTASRTFTQNGNIFGYPGSGVVRFGDSIPSSVQARVSINNTGLTGNYLDIGSEKPYSPTAVTQGKVNITVSDTVKVNTNLRTAGLFTRRKITIDTSGNITFSDKYNVADNFVFFLRDTIHFSPLNADLLNAHLTDLEFRKNPTYTGRSVVSSGSASLGFDAANALLGRIQIIGSSAGNGFRLRGFYSSVTGHLVGSNNTEDTVDNFTNFLAVSGGALSPVVTRGYNFLGTMSVKVDTLYGVYIYPSTARNYLGGSLQLGSTSALPSRIFTQTNDPSLIFEVNSTTKSMRGPIMTGVQMAAISAPTNGSLIYNLDSLAYCWYNGASWTKIGSGGVGSGGITTLNTLTAGTQTFATGTSGSDFNISSATSTHTFNIPDAGASARGLVTTGTQTLAGAKTFSSAPTFSSISATQLFYAGTGGLVSGDAAIIRTGSGAVSFGTSTTSPILIGGTSTTATLTIQPTSGAGTTGANILFKGGNNGADEYARIFNAGGMAVGSTTLTDPVSGTAKFKVVDGSQVFTMNGNGGQGWYGISNGTITGLLGHTNTTDGLVFGAVTNHAMRLRTNNTTRFVILNSGEVGIGNITPSARLHIQAGTATAGTGPLKYTTGTLLTTPEVGVSEYNNAHYETNSGINRYAKGGAIADFITDVSNSGTSETDLYTYTTKANTFAANGEKIFAEFSGVTTGSATATRTFKIYFGGTQIFTSATFDSGINALGMEWVFKVTLIRASSSEVRAVIHGVSNSIAMSDYVVISGLTLSGTNILKITGQAGGTGAGSSQITAGLGSISWFGAANN